MYPEDELNKAANNRLGQIAAKVNKERHHPEHTMLNA